MATYTIIEINGDHIHGCDDAELGRMIKAVASNPRNITYLRNRCEDMSVIRAVRPVCVLGNPMDALGYDRPMLDCMVK